MTEAAPPGWDGILEPGEEILWQGRPGQGIFYDGSVSHIIMGVVVTGFALFWTGAAFVTTWGEGFPSALMPLFGLLFLYQGIGKAGGFALWDAYVRARTWYTLTNRRAFIAKAVLGRRSLDHWRADSFGEVVHDFGPPAAVWFARTDQKTSRRVGFRDIDDAHTVMALIRDMRKDSLS